MDCCSDITYSTFTPLEMFEEIHKWCDGLTAVMLMMSCKGFAMFKGESDKNERVVRLATRDNKVAILEWCVRVGHKLQASDCSEAASLDNLDVLKILRKNGCPWDEEARMCAIEAMSSDVLEWLEREEVGYPWSSREGWDEGRIMRKLVNDGRREGLVGRGSSSTWGSVPYGWCFDGDVVDLWYPRVEEKGK